MVVTPETFRLHLQTLKRLFTLLPLSEWVERNRNGKALPPRTCAITFDDGWRDNYEYALPILQEEQVPATIFAVAEMIGTQRQFWPNRLIHALNAAGANWVQHFNWLPQPALCDGKMDLSRELIASVIANCKKLSDEVIEEQLDRLEEKLGLGAQPAALMDWQQLRSMQHTGLVEIGSHTCTHRRLVEGLDSAVLEREIVASKAILSQQLDQPVTLFCYPNGDVSKAALQLVSTHYQAAVTTRPGINRPDTPITALARIGIHEDVSNSPLRFNARLSGWG